MLKQHIKVILVGGTICSSVLLSGCSAIQTEVEHHQLEVNSKMSSSLFLPPVSKKDKTIYVSVKNTSTQQNLGLKPILISALQNKGWKVTSDFKDAHDVLQINVLQVGKVKDAQSAYSSLENGFGGALVGSMAGSMLSDSGEGAIAGGLIGGVTSFVGGMLVKDVTYSMTTDIQLSVKAPKGQKITQRMVSNSQEGSSTTSTQVSNSDSNRMNYRTRIVSVASKVNLKFAQARLLIAKQTASEIANIF